MTLKVIKYKNYGCTIVSKDDQDFFYFSFYELNNGKIIELSLQKNFQNGKYNFTDYVYSYTKFTLKTGAVIEYKFGNAKGKDDYCMANEFYEWFDSSPIHSSVIDYLSPTDEEIKCVKGFYLKHIKNTNDIKTNTLVV